MPRLPARLGLALSLLAGLGDSSLSAQPGVLDVPGTTVGAPSAALPLFGSAPGACVPGTVPEPYDLTDVNTDTAGEHVVDVVEPVRTIPDTDDTVLLVYETAFDPVDPCANFLGIGNERVGEGLALDLAAGDHVLVVAGFLGTQDAYTVRITGPEGSTITSDRVVAVGGGPEAATFAVGPAYPNPARTTAVIPFRLAEAGPSRLAVYDALGREVAGLAEEALAAGRHEAALDVAALPVGVYVVHLVTRSGRRTAPLTVAR